MGEMNQLKVFTVEEANRLLPRIVSLIEELRQKRQGILQLEVEIDALELVTVKDASGFSPALNRRVEEYNRLVTAFYSLVDSIHETGCFLKDVEMGLVDFYSLQNGRVIYLCWKMGEPRVSFWHEVGRGFSSRQPISPVTGPKHLE